jgi:hypothetical protein
MKATIEKQLPEEQKEFELHLKGPTYHSVLRDLDAFLRDQAKYHDRAEIPIEEMRSLIRELLWNAGCSLEDG